MDSSAKVERQEKHVCINESLGGLHGATNRLNDLVCRVRDGSPADKAVEGDATPHTLLSTLDGTPGELNGAANSIDSCVKELQELLF